MLCSKSLSLSPFIYKSLFMIAYDGNSRPRQYYLNILIIPSSLNFIFCQHSYIKNASIVKAKKKTLLLFFPDDCNKKNFCSASVVAICALWMHLREKTKKEGGVAATSLLLCILYSLCMHRRNRKKVFIYSWQTRLTVARQSVAISAFCTAKKTIQNALSTSCKSIKCFSGKRSRQINAFFLCALNILICGDFRKQSFAACLRKMCHKRCWF